ncbi:MAG: 3-hydroxyacyl-CoA dehydrogenase/enoyl-CoA hydratase family protein [Planctomycetes bacterium]|nr:3-hydroxyacyl-CoA dehydrogenase/enoyl-CoA hydratase family protein [Planctomycetota bacterium]
MSYQAFGRTIRKVGVVGSGQIGPDIALYFSKVLAEHDVPVVVTDVVPAALEAGAAKTKKKLDKGVETGAFKRDQADRILANLSFSADPDALRGADFVVEAATERLEVKRGIFASLEDRVGPDTILASNSSHLEPETIFEGLRHPERSLVIHYFFPAERNPLVEVVPGARTEATIWSFCLRFYEAIGKVPIRVGSRYGYAVDPIFEGLFLAAALLVESGTASPKQVDAIACKVLGLGVGPFTAMNLTGGNPLTQVGLGHYHDKLMPWFRSPSVLDRQVEAKAPWETAARGEAVVYDEATFAKVSAVLTGAYFGLATEVLDSGITNVADLEMAVELGLVMEPPFALMNRVGVPEALARVRGYAAANPGFKVAGVLERQAAAGKPWRIPVVLREDRAGVALVTIRRPRVLNALDRETFVQLRETFDALRDDPSIRAVVLTGFGPKAFVSGADIGMLARIQNPADGERLCLETGEAVAAVDGVGKPVVCALNGLALGGGNELAMACTARIARKGLRLLAGQPEPKLGFIPGAGGTQRLPRLIPFEKAWTLLRTAGTLSSAEALACGLIREEVEGDLLARAVELARELADGRTRVAPIPRGPIAAPAGLPEPELGGLSRRIDELLRRAILEGARLTLAEGVRLEARLFGECCATQDMKLGLENFQRTNLKEPARFVHA